MALKTKFDIDNENFNYYFERVSSPMTDKQREVLPKELYFKLFKLGGKFDSKSTYKLSFLAKLFILIKSLRKRVIILIEDEQNGMDEEAFFKYKSLLSKREFTTSAAEDLIEDSVFVLGNKELMDTHSLLNELSASPAYKYLTKAKNPVPNHVETHKKQMEYVARFLVHYESKRKDIAVNQGLNMSEWLLLLWLYSGEEKQGADSYNKIYKYSFNSSMTRLKVAFGTLEMKGYIEKFGKGKGMKMRITVLGKDKVNGLINNSVINC